MRRISSRHHPIVRRFRALASGPDAGAVLLDGEHLVAEALLAGVPIEAVLADDQARLLADRAAAAGAEVFEAPGAVVAAARPVRAAGGIAAIARWSPASLTRVFDETRTFVVGLVDVQDPGNVGGAIRSSDALGAGAVAALGQSADPAGWKALRGAMGSTFRIPVARGSVRDALAEAQKRGALVVATVAEHGTPLDAADLTQPMLMLVGNEGAGLPEAAVSAAGRSVTIPMRAGVNSLNVAVTVAIVLWERRRQLAARRST